MRGDVNVLKRVEAQSRRADRIQKKLRKKLRRDDEGPPVYTKRCKYGRCGREDTLHPTRVCGRYVRRLLRKNRESGRRDFHASEVGGTPGENFGFGVLVMPAHANTTPEQAVQRVLKLNEPSRTLRMDVCPGLPLLHVTAGGATVRTAVFGGLLGGRPGGDHQDRQDDERGQNGQESEERVFTVDAVPYFAESDGPPLLLLRVVAPHHSVLAASACGMDESMFKQLQSATMRLLSAIEVR